jgi:acetyl-CoA C-acetyltransferase
MKNREVVVVSACRTAIGKFMGELSKIKARELAIAVGSKAIERAGIEADIIDEIVMGEVYSGMQGSLPARQVGMRLGLPHRSGSLSVNQNCASGMRAMEIACQNIILNKTDIGLVIGVESMTNTPYLLPKGRMGHRMGPGKVEDSMLHDGLIDELVPGHMGITAENIAEKYGITRKECDELAVISHNRACKAIEEGVFDREIIPVEIKTKKGLKVFKTDEHPIRNASMDTVGKLKPAFKEDGVVTAANASGINDGAAAIIVMSKEKAEELGLKPLMKLVNICTEGVDPKFMGVGPAVAINKCLNQANINFEDCEYWECNEAFAAQFIGAKEMLKEDFGYDLLLDKVNHNGSGIALGHPVGCTGLRIIVSLYYEMERMDYTLGGATLCVGGGSAMASLWTREI